MEVYIVESKCNNASNEIAKFENETIAVKVILAWLK